MKFIGKLTALALIGATVPAMLPSQAAAGTAISISYRDGDYRDRHYRRDGWRGDRWDRHDRRDHRREWRRHHSNWNGYRDRRCWTEWHYDRYYGERVPVRICR